MGEEERKKNRCFENAVNKTKTWKLNRVKTWSNRRLTAVNASVLCIRGSLSKFPRRSYSFNLREFRVWPRSVRRSDEGKGVRDKRCKLHGAKWGIDDDSSGKEISFYR